jgi:hypothetical protein
MATLIVMTALAVKLLRLLLGWLVLDALKGWRRR